MSLWEGFCLPEHPNNLLTMLWTRQSGEISDNNMYKGDFQEGVGAIKVRA